MYNKESPENAISKISGANHVLVGGLEHFLFSIIYGNNHHPKWLSYFSRWLKPPTSVGLQGNSKSSSRLRINVMAGCCLMLTVCWPAYLVVYNCQRLPVVADGQKRGRTYYFSIPKHYRLIRTTATADFYHIYFGDTLFSDKAICQVGWWCHVYFSHSIPWECWDPTRPYFRLKT